MAGFEPATPRLEVWCAIHCATRAKVSPGLEPGLSDSKSEMLTITSRNQLSHWGDLNTRQMDLQSTALPTELQ